MLEKLKKLKERNPDFAARVSYYRQLTKIRNRGGSIEEEKFEDLRADGRVAEGEDRDFCISNINTMNVTVDGKVTICSDDYEETDIFGSIDADKPDVDNRGRTQLENIWRKREFETVRKNIRKQIYDCRVCQDCSIGGAAKNS